MKNQNLLFVVVLSQDAIWGHGSQTGFINPAVPENLWTRECLAVFSHASGPHRSTLLLLSGKKLKGRLLGRGCGALLGVWVMPLCVNVLRGRWTSWELKPADRISVCVAWMEEEFT